MKLPRLKISSVMILVAIVGLNLAVFRALISGRNEELLVTALPTVDLLIFVGFVGFSRARPFTVGFVVVGSLSLLTYLAWTENRPWSWLHDFEPLLQTIARFVMEVYPNTYIAIMFTIATVFHTIPHSVLGLAGGFLVAKGRGDDRATQKGLKKDSSAVSSKVCDGIPPL